MSERANHSEEAIGCLASTCKACEGCDYATLGDDVREIGPTKMWCLAYRVGSGTCKPEDVMFRGAPCPLASYNE